MIEDGRGARQSMNQGLRTAALAGLLLAASVSHAAIPDGTVDPAHIKYGARLTGGSGAALERRVCARYHALLGALLAPLRRRRSHRLDHQAHDRTRRSRGRAAAR